jgi:hypothetical protein
MVALTLRFTHRLPANLAAERDLGTDVREVEPAAVTSSSTVVGLKPTCLAPSPFPRDLTTPVASRAAGRAAATRSHAAPSVTPGNLEARVGFHRAVGERRRSVLEHAFPNGHLKRAARMRRRSAATRNRAPDVCRNPVTKVTRGKRPVAAAVDGRREASGSGARSDRDGARPRVVDAGHLRAYQADRRPINVREGHVGNRRRSRAP